MTICDYTLLLSIFVIALFAAYLIKTLIPKPQDKRPFQSLLEEEVLKRQVSRRVKQDDYLRKLDLGETGILYRGSRSDIVSSSKGEVNEDRLPRETKPRGQ